MTVFARRLIVLAMALGTVITVLALNAPSVGLVFEQGSDINEAEREAKNIQAEIEVVQAELESRSSPDGMRLKFLCYGPYVEPGTEVYAVLGVSGCVQWDPRRTP